jgi:tRNA pseudouridine55 synthase
MNSFEEGRILLINKPMHWTSFDVVRKIRHLTRTRKVGHAGTLDPLATGLLIVCTGKFTKRINEFMAKEKAYSGSMILGATTPTYDLEREPGNFKEFDSISINTIQDAVITFTGEILQIPPAHSAIKKDGKRVYELARKGIEVKLEPRKIFIKDFQLINIEMPKIMFGVVCSTGTYIRSLAHDFGAHLGCGAYLSSLVRTRIGEFDLAESMTIDEFEQSLKEL